MEFRTKREAEVAAQEEDRKADSALESAVLYDAGSVHAAERRAARTRHQAKAARIRALLPTLPD